MSNYTQNTFFTIKDSLPATDPNKTIFGAAYDTELGNIATAITSKYDSATQALLVGSLTTGGLLGVGTINLSGGYYVNNVNITQTGTFTGTLTGCTTAPTSVFNYTIINGSIVVVDMAASLSATSNSVACTITGLPAALRPVRTQRLTVHNVVDNSVNGLGFLDVTNSTIMTLSTTTIATGRVIETTVFTNANTKGLAGAVSFAYNLV